MVILGGAGTLFGPAIGAALFVSLQNIISGYTERWLIVLGVIYVLVGMFAPNGLVGFVRRFAQAKGRAMSALIVRRSPDNFGGVQALSGVSLAVEPGERRLIIGPNGAGKTTLFNMLSGAFAVSSGKIMLFDRDITIFRPMSGQAWASRARSRSPICFLVSLCWRMYFSRSAEEITRVFRASVQAGQRRICFTMPATLLESWGLSAIADQPRKTFPMGNSARSTWSLAWHQPKVLLLDEPTSGLSAAEVVRVVGMIRTLPREMTILIIEHDMDVAFELADRITVLHQGRLIAEGNAPRQSATIGRLRTSISAPNSRNAEHPGRPHLLCR